jgi:iron complex transport system substrate-binding protein
MRSPALLLLMAAVAAATAGRAEPIGITDQSGRRVELETPVRRVVAIPIPSASMLVAVSGGVERLAAMNHLAKTAILEGVLGEFFPQARAIPSDVAGEGFAPNVEAILARSPDLVLQWGDRGPDIVRPLTEVGLPVLLLRYGTEELAREWLELLGAATAERARAERLVAWREEVRRSLAPLAGLTDGERPKVLYFLRFLAGQQVAGRGTYNDFTIRLAGGRNAADELQGFKPVGAEQVLLMDPDVILLNGFEEALEPRHVLEHPVLGASRAARAGRVYKMPLGGYRWDPPSQESPLAWLWLAGLLHPERVSVDLRAAVVEAYGWLYGRAPSAEQLDRILRTPIQGDAPGYGRLRG